MDDPSGDPDMLAHDLLLLRKSRGRWRDTYGIVLVAWSDDHPDNKCLPGRRSRDIAGTIL